MKTVLWLVTGLVAHGVLHQALAAPAHFGFYKRAVVAVAYKPPPIYHVPPPPTLPPVAY